MSSSKRVLCGGAIMRTHRTYGVSWRTMVVQPTRFLRNMRYWLGLDRFS